jgi:hypothetical protein
VDNRIREERITQARAEIARRIERFCQSLPRDEFDQLVDQMTELHCKYDVFPNVPELAEVPDLDALVLEQIRMLEKPIRF